MTLGFWHRLFIVLALLTLLIAPLWVMVVEAEDRGQGSEAYQRSCMQEADALGRRATTDPVKANEITQKGYKNCEEVALSLRMGYTSPWEQWQYLAWAFAQLIGIIYVLCWIMFFVGRWVWNGKTYRTGIK